MCKLNKKTGLWKIDSCMRNTIKFLRYINFGTLSCCCGHGKYPMTIIVKRKGKIYDMISGKEIPRKKRFYKKDKQGYYYIPEVCSEFKGKKNLQ